MTPDDQKFVRSVLARPRWPLIIFFSLIALVQIVLGLIRVSMGIALARDAGISAWDAMSNSSAVATAANVKLAVAASMQLSEAAITFLGALIFLLIPLQELVLYRRLRRIFRELPAATAVASQPNTALDRPGQ